MKLLQKAKCDYCGREKHQAKPNKYCIKCSFNIKRNIKMLRDNKYNSGSGGQYARRHWDNLPHYIKYDIQEHLGVNV